MSSPTAPAATHPPAAPGIAQRQWRFQKAFARSSICCRAKRPVIPTRTLIGAYMLNLNGSPPWKSSSGPYWRQVAKKTWVIYIPAFGGSLLLIFGALESIRAQQSLGSIAMAGPVTTIEANETSPFTHHPLMRGASKEAAVTIAIQLKKLRPAAGRVSAAFTIRAGDNLRRTLGVPRDRDRRRKALRLLSGGVMEIEITNTPGLKVIRKRFPARPFLKKPHAITSQATVILPISVGSGATRYPSDLYAFVADVDARFIPLGGETARRDLPALVTVQLGYSFTGMVADAQQQADLEDGSIAMIIRRTAATVRFVYLLTAAPAVLILIVFLSLFRPFRARTAGTDVGVAVGLLAIFPLRAVLVPPDIPGITFLDRLLGLQVVAIVAAAAWRHAVTFPSEAWPIRARRPRYRPRDRPPHRRRS